ncbi:MAG: limonene-1,2-epoxide hydrolase family protein [Acidimicrobiia bacterium]|jgi:limonene-1,2-epoxide hydrolase
MSDAPAPSARPTTTSDDPIDVVRSFLAALERLDIDAAVGLLADDVRYQNVPLPAAEGIDAVEKQLRWLARYGDGFEVEWINVAADGGTVLTERTDALVFGRVRAAFWVCGTFEVRGGKIVLWRDRFDFVDVTWAFLRGGAKALLDAARDKARN